MNSEAQDILMAAGVIIFIILVGSLLYVGSVSNNQTQQETPKPSGNLISKAQADPKERVASLKEQNNSGQTGSVNLKENAQKVIIMVNIKKGPENVPQPSHIHAGDCTNLGQIIHPLTNVVNGSAQTTISTTLDDLKNSAPLAVNVHKSNEENQTYVACANLEFTNPTDNAKSSPKLNQP